MTSLSGTDAVILAGGLGTRLRGSLQDKPKTLAPINGRPFLYYLINQIKSFGVDRIVLSLGYLSDMVEAWVKDAKFSDLEIIFSTEKTPLGTGGGLNLALEHTSSDTVLVMNGDSYTKVDLVSFMKFHTYSKSDISLVATLVNDTRRFGTIHIDDQNRLKRFAEKQESITIKEGYINSGIYLINRSCLPFIPSFRTISLEQEILPWLISKRFHVMKGRYPFIDIGTPESYQVSNAFFNEVVNDY